MRAVNLIPAEQRTATTGVPGRSEGAAYLVLALLAGVALLAVLYGRAHREIASKRAQVTSLNARAQQLQAQASGLAPYTSFTALREERERAVSQLVDSRFDWAHSFHELGRVLPSTAAIDSIDGTIGSSTVSGSGSGTSASPSGSKSAGAVSATPPGSVPQVTLTGCATSQKQVALTLNRLRLMDGVSEVTLQNSTESNSGTSSGTSPGGCPPSAPSFTIQVTYDPLPAPSAISSSAPVPASLGGAR